MRCFWICHHLGWKEGWFAKEKMSLRQAQDVAVAPDQAGEYALHSGLTSRAQDPCAWQEAVAVSDTERKGLSKGQGGRGAGARGTLEWGSPAQHQRAEPHHGPQKTLWMPPPRPQ